MRDKKPARRNIALGLEGALAGLAWKHDSQIRDGPTVNLHGLEDGSCGEGLGRCIARVHSDLADVL